MYGLKKLERYLWVNLLGPGRALVLWKKNLPGRGLTKVEKHWSREFFLYGREGWVFAEMRLWLDQLANSYGDSCTI
jgi:hypothetical protein